MKKRVQIIEIVSRKRLSLCVCRINRIAASNLPRFQSICFCPSASRQDCSSCIPRGTAFRLLPFRYGLILPLFLPFPVRQPLKQRPRTYWRTFGRSQSGTSRIILKFDSLTEQFGLGPVLCVQLNFLEPGHAQGLRVFGFLLSL